MQIPTASTKPRETERGFVLVGLIVAIFLILLALSVAAPRVAKALRREREVEAMHRGDQYVRAIQVYYRKNGTYPGSIEQLEKSNNIRYLRQRYADPMTGKANWRIIHVGQNKTTVKGFFGKPLGGLSGGGLGSAAGMTSNNGASGTMNGSPGSSFGTSSFGSSSGSSGLGSSGLGSSSSGSSSFGASSPSTGSSPSGTTDSGTSGTVMGSSSSSGSPGMSSQSATSFTGTGAPIMGIGSSATGDSIVVLNEQKTYPTWEFIYDPRIEQLKAKASLLGGGPGSTPASSFGSSATSPGLGGSSPSGFGGSSPSGFGGSSPSGFGGSGSSGSGSSGFGGSSFGSSSFGSSGSGNSSSPSSPSPSNTPQ